MGMDLSFVLEQLPLGATEAELKEWQEQRIRHLLKNVPDGDLFLQMLGYEVSPPPVSPRRTRYDTN